jgi:DNA adenine methylase
LIYEKGTGSDVRLGFATFFLNRTNRSGILSARPIGGLHQTGKWGIDARYDGARLAERITRIGEYSSRVTICSEDGIDLTARYLGDGRSFIYVDPPYLQKGDDLYLDNLNWSDHERLAEVLKPAQNWMLTYDRDPRALKLYRCQRCALFGIAHTAGVQHIGNEYAVFADGLTIPAIRDLGRGDARFVRRSSLSTFR